MKSLQQIAEEIANILPFAAIDSITDYVPDGTGAFILMENFEGVVINRSEVGFCCELVDFASGDTYPASFETEAEVKAFCLGCYLTLTK